MIVDATACPQDIRYPTDMDLLNDDREKSEELIDVLFCPDKHKSKPRTYNSVGWVMFIVNIFRLYLYAQIYPKDTSIKPYSQIF
jgi:hypothetical protein